MVKRWKKWCCKLNKKGEIVGCGQKVLRYQKTDRFTYNYKCDVCCTVFTAEELTPLNNMTEILERNRIRKEKEILDS